MEVVSIGYEGNAVARTVARRMIEQAIQDQEENGSDESIADDDNEPDEEEYGFDADEEDNNSYDSDDPRSFGGEYYWDRTTDLGRQDNAQVTVRRVFSDHVRLWVFHLLRAFGFIILVLQHFFGLNHSRFQWAVDLVEQERARRDMEVLSRSNYRRESSNRS